MIQPSATCRQCGAPLNPRQTRGLCAACLLETSLSVEKEPEGAEPVDTAWLERNRLASAPVIPQGAHRFGDYELFEEIGRGGMGVIYRAKQLSLDRTVAVKTILTGPLASPDFVQRFHTEAHAAAVLDHPNIVPIYDVGEHEGQPFYSMRLVDGRNLAEELKQTGPMSSRRAAELVATVAHAVHYAHQRGVLHRDLKPANILLDAEGHPHVTDFGLAKLLEQDDGLTLTQAALGTPNYMAPEQAVGDASKLTTAADVYSLGAILFELLTGRKLFNANTPLATINQAREQEPPKPSAVVRNIPRDLDTICWKCLEKEPHRRYASAQALVEDLERWLKGEPIRARRVGTLERVGLWCRRKPAMAGMAGAAMAAVLIVSGIATWRLMVARSEKQLEQYAANISLADSYIRDGATDRAMELLLQCPEHLRHWEWGRLVYLCHQEIATILAHTDHARALDEPQISAMALNRPGTRLATKGHDGEFRLWSITNAEAVFIRDDRTNEVSAWGFSPEGTELVLGTADGTLGKVDSETGEERWLLRPEPASGAVAVRGPPRKILFFDLDPRETRPVYAPIDRPESVLAIAYFPNGRRIVVGKGNGEILVLEASTGAEDAKWKYHLPDLEKLWFTPDSSLLVAKASLGFELIDPGSGISKATNVWPEAGTAKVFVDSSARNAVIFEASGTAHLWKRGKVTSTLQQYPFRMLNSRAAFFDPTGRWVCMTGKSTVAGVFEVETGRQVLSPNQDVNGAVFSHDGQRLVTFGPDRLIRLWDVAQGRELRILRGHLSVPELSTFTTDGRFIVTASREGVVKLWTGSPGRELVAAEGVAPTGCYASDGQNWATALTWNGTFVCEADSGSVAAEFPLQKGAPISMAFSPDGKFLVAAGTEKVARIWDVPGRRLAGLLRGHDHVIWSVAWSIDGRRIATGDCGGVARIWDATTWRETLRIRAQSRHLRAVQMDPAGRKLLTAGYGPPKVWDLETGSLLLELDDEEGGCCWGTFSPDGRWIMCPCADGTIRFWDAASGKLVKRWTSRGQGWALCGFSPDSRRLVVPVVDHGTLGFAAPFLQVWDVDRDRHLFDLRGHTDAIFGASFDPRGTRILSFAMDETVRQWESFPWRKADYGDCPGATLAQRIRSYADLYWRERAAAEQKGSLAGDAKLLGSKNTPTPREWEQVLRPVRSPNTPSNLLNLDDVYTGALEGVFRPELIGTDGDDDLSQLPKGVVALQGINFDIRGVVLLRMGKVSPDFWFAWLDHPVRVDKIQVGRKIRQLHVLHATVGHTKPSTVVGSYVLHYADGSQQELEIVYARDVRDWWLGGRGDPEAEVSHACVGWLGSNPISEQHRTQVRLFHSAYENPNPDVEVVSVDFVSKQAAAAPFLVAMTVEL